MPKKDEKDYLERRLASIVEAVNEFAEGNFDLELPVEGTDDQLDLVAIGLNIMKAELHKAEKDYSQELKKSRELAKEMERRLKVIEEQREAIEALSTPIIELWDEVLTLPVVGTIDSARSQDMMEKLLGKIVDTEARSVIIDITGVEGFDTHTSNIFLQMVRAAKLLGAKCILTGISPGLAQTLTNLGVDLGEITTLRTLKDGLKEAFKMHGYRVLRLDEKNPKGPKGLKGPEGGDPK